MTTAEQEFADLEKRKQALGGTAKTLKATENKVYMDLEKKRLQGPEQK